MRRTAFALVTGLSMAGLMSGCMSPEGATISEKRAAVQEMRTDTLAKLYDIHPIAQEQIRDAAGYGVFSNIGVNLVLLSAGSGFGVVRDNGTDQDVYMKMVSGGVGIGLGAKDFRGVFVFETDEALRNFVDSGWDASGQADAVAKAGDKGASYAGAIDIAPGIKLYQITENGLALQATIQGTKYWRDDDLS